MNIKKISRKKGYCYDCGEVKQVMKAILRLLRDLKIINYGYCHICGHIIDIPLSKPKIGRFKGSSHVSAKSIDLNLVKRIPIK